MKEQITDELTLVLTNVNEERYTYSISPTDCFLVTMDDSILAFLPLINEH